jgi:hypothetical protein
MIYQPTAMILGTLITCSGDGSCYVFSFPLSVVRRFDFNFASSKLNSLVSWDRAD